MARMIPELTQEQLRELPSRAEARFYEECRRQLSTNILVIHSTTWLYRDARGQIREGEGDFAIVDPRSGVFAIELKGGGVSVDGTTGRWASIDRHGTRHEIKDPFRQASKERYALRDQLTGHSLWRRWRGTQLLLGHAVMFPDIHDATPLVGPDRARQLIGIDDNMRDLAAWFAQVVAFWHNTDSAPLGAEGIRLVEDILCRSVEVRPALRSLLDDAEQTRLRLTANQAKVLRILGGRRRAVISGGAGTGKTLIAVEKARQLADSVPSVLLLCYNRPLADALAATVRDQPRIAVLNFHQLCERRIAACRTIAGKDVMKEAQEAYPGTGNKHLFDVQMPYALALSNEILEEKFSALVVDEAQDFNDDYWFSVEELLSDSAECPLYIFIDENQALYRRHTNLPVKDDAFNLTSNCRNTAPIHRVGYVYYTGAPVDEPELPGQEVRRVAIEGDTAQADAIASSVRGLLAEGVRPEDITLLLAKQPKALLYGLIQAHRLPGGVAWSIESPGRRNAILVDTVARFKGLESPVVVLWLGDETVEREAWELVYVGATRAKSLILPPETVSHAE